LARGREAVAYKQALVSTRVVSLLFTRRQRCLRAGYAPGFAVHFLFFFMARLQ